MVELFRSGDDDADAVYAALLSAIYSRDLPPQTKLSEETIAASTATSRQAVRAALNRLCADSLVTFERNRGAFIASPDDREADDVFGMWAMMEAEVARMLAPIITEEQLASLQANVDENRRHARAGNNRLDGDTAQQFHLLLVDVIGNASLTSATYRLICRSALIMAVHPRSQRTEYGLDEHQDIIDRLTARDGEGAARAASGHLLNTLARARQIHEVTTQVGLADILSRHVPRKPAASVKRGSRRSAP